MLEYEAKVSRTVLRRGRASNRSFLFGTADHAVCASLRMNKANIRADGTMQEHTGTQNDNFSSRLIFEKSRKNTFKKCPHLPDALARSTLAIPELSEPEVIRHYTALSKLNFGMDTGM